MNEGFGPNPLYDEDFFFLTFLSFVRDLSYALTRTTERP